MKCALLLACALLTTGLLVARQTLVIASIETQEDQDPTALFAANPLPQQHDSEATTWSTANGQILLSTFDAVLQRQEAIYARHANTERGQALLHAREDFASCLKRRLGTAVNVEVMTRGQLPSTTDVALLRIVVARQFAEVNALQPMRTQLLTISAEDLQGRLIFSMPVVDRAQNTTDEFNLRLFLGTLEKAANEVAVRITGRSNFDIIASPEDVTFEIGAATWNPALSVISVCTLSGQRIAPASRSVIADLQPQRTIWIPKVSTVALPQNDLGIGVTRIGGITEIHNSSVVRGLLANAFTNLNMKASLLGSQQDLLRPMTLGRQVSVQILSYQESIAPSAAATSLPLVVTGHVSMSGLVTVVDRKTNNILCAEVVSLDIPVEHRLDANNLETTPFDPCEASKIFAHRVAETVKKALFN